MPRKVSKKSKLGYSKGSPYRKNPYLDIDTPEGLIDMSNTDIPLLGIDNTGVAQMMMPFSGLHQFQGNTVREIPIQSSNYRRSLQMGGMSPSQLYSFMFEDEEEEDITPQAQPEAIEIPAEEAVQAERTPEDDATYNQALEIAMEDFVGAEQSGRRWNLLFGEGEEAGEGLSGIPAAALPTGDSSKYAYNYLQTKGVAPHIAAGIVGNLIQESGLNPTIKGDNGKATGIAQWHPDRFNELKNWATSSGRNPYSLETQLDYVLVEAQQRGDMDALKNTKNSGEAAYVFAKKFEKPKVIDTKRISYARSLNPYKDGGSVK